MADEQVSAPQAEPAQSEPAQSEPVQPEPAPAAPTQTEAAHVESDAGPAGPMQKAGAVIISESKPDSVLLLYRALRDDWTFPKGHVDAGETPEAAMMREVGEETGLAVHPLMALAPFRYVDSLGHDSVVEMWLVRSLSDAALRPEAGGDRFEWLTFDDARAKLTYANLAEWFDAQRSAVASELR